MKVIFVTREGRRLPGARIRCYNFSGELRKRGIETEVLSFSDTLGAKDGEFESQLVLRERMRYNWMAFNRLRQAKGAIIYIQRLNYHVFAPLVTHVLYNNKIVLDLDDWEMRDDPGYHWGFFPSSKAHFLTAQLAKRSIFCVAASRFLEGFLREFNPEVYYIPSGVDTALFQPSFAEERDKLVISWIGTFNKMEYVENIKFAINCFLALRKKYGHIFFEIVGDGIFKNTLLKEVISAGDKNIQLKEWIPPEQMPDYLEGIQIGIFPAIRKNKFNQAKSPTKLFEYMAMAKPTVSGDIGEAAHIIQDGENGFLASNQEDFINKLQLLIESPRLCAQMGAAARRSAEAQYSLPKITDRLAQALDKFNV